MSETKGGLPARAGAVLAALGLVGAIGASGCGGGDGGDDSSTAGFLGSQDDGPKDVCRDSSLGYYAPRAPRPTGTARFTPNPITEDRTEMELIEVTCEALRDAEGRVAGFFASFFSEWDASFLVDFAAVIWKGQFNGPGEYEDARLAYYYDDDLDPSGMSGALVIEADGLSGRFSAAGGELAFSCGDASKLSLETVPWPPLAAGTARAVGRMDGIVYEFPGISCGVNLLDEGKFEISDDFGPYGFRYKADGSGSGSHRLEESSTDYAGTYDSYSSGGGTLTLDCGASPVSGTINDNITFVCQP